MVFSPATAPEKVFAERGVDEGEFMRNVEWNPKRKTRVSHPTVIPFSFRRRIQNANLRARSINIPARGNFSFFHLLAHFIFFLAPCRPTDLDSGELLLGKLRAPPFQSSPRAKIVSVDRECLPAANSWSRSEICSKSGDLLFTGASSDHRAINDIRLAQPFSVSSSTALNRIPTLKELEEELEGQARMATKVQEAENKRASKARNREGERGQWWPCETTDAELRELQNEGMISSHWSFMRDSDVPKPDADERVMTKAWVERGLSLPPTEFFLSILNTYGLQPHNICQNSYLLLSNFATLYEGHLGIRPDVRLWQFFFRVNCGSMTFMLRPGRMYPPHDSHESVRYWNAGWFYEKNIPVPAVHEGLPKFNNKPPEELASWSFIPSLALIPTLEKTARRISWLLDTLAEEDLRNILRVPVSGDAAEEDPADDDEEEEHMPRKDTPRPSKRPRAKASASKPELAARPLPRSPRNPSTTTAWTNVQEPITKYMKKSPAIGPATPVPPSTSHAAPQPSPPQAEQSPPPATETPPEIIPVSSEKVGEENSGAKGPTPEEAEVESREEAKANSTGKAEAAASDIVVFPKNFGDPADLTSTPKAYATKFFNKLTEAEKWDLEQDLLNAMMSNAWGKPDTESSEIQDFKKGFGQFLDKLLCKQKVLPSASSSLAAASSELETLRSARKDLETKLAEAEKELTEKSSELIQKTGEFEMKRKADRETIQRQQKELNGLRRYMETAEQHWDLLNEDILEPLGYHEKRRKLFPRDDLLQLAGDDCKDLISACWEICHNLSIKKSRTCEVRKLIKRMDILPELVVDLQASSARSVAAMSLAMCLAHNPDLDLDRVTTGVPQNADVSALLDAVSGYNTRIARRICHDEFYDKVVLPADEPLEAELHKKSEAETRPAQSGSQYTWTSSKDKGGATSPAEDDEKSDDDVSSPAKGKEEEDPKGDDKGESSPAKEK
ncbi:hypothetical protein QYE76_054401 [Lolium multiflorum]|uniref:Transposase (putative) gypsy type domain-containing protein n=1 Tax=Lolium multiflorum TaxID=4521 RepID=A0AAD8SYI2_LOLMU|nr:hypothetical protein QYE76_054401 [Lolium multiflorum]